MTQTMFFDRRSIWLGMALIVLLSFARAVHADEHGWHEREFHEHPAAHDVHEHEFREQEFRQHEFLDAHYHHDHYYPPHGFVFAVVPPNPVIAVHGGVRFYFSAGVWYRYDGPARFVVVAPPIGITVGVLPPFYTALWVGGVPYYYANDVYYMRAPQGYVVVAPPPPGSVVTEQAPPVVAAAPTVVAPPPTTVAQAPAEQVFAYPRQGQSETQQATDRYECHRWAVSQTGVDPTLSSTDPTLAAQKRPDYQRALGACLDARGYTVK